MRKPCPKCQSEGNDTSGNGIKVYDDGHGHCFKCNTTYSKRQMEGSSVQPRKKQSNLTVSQVQTYPIGNDPARKISEKVCTDYGVRYSANVETGKPDQIFYPTHDEEQGISGYKVRKLPKDWSSSVGTIGKALFGIQKLPKQVSSQQAVLVLTEGEEDCLAVAEMCKTNTTVVPMSMPNGANLNDTVRNQLIEIAPRFKKVYIVFDADTKGKEASIEVADVLSTIITTHVVTLDRSHGKDASDYHTNGKKSEFLAAIKDSEPYEPEGVINGVDIALDDLLEPLPEGYEIPFLGLQDKLHGLRKGEITTICAGSGIGKSTLVREIGLSLIEQGASIANVALEDQMNVAAQAYMALDMNIPLPVFRVSPPLKSEVQPSYDKVIANGHTFFWKHFAGIKSESLMNKLYYYARTKQVDFIILDHLSLVISASESQNERKDIDTLMTQLAKLVVETGVGLVQIVHLKRTSGDKSFAKGGEVELTDLRGSAAIEQLSWSVVGLERDQQGEDRDFSTIRLLKNRTWGFTGLCDNVKFDPSTGRMRSVVKEAEEILVAEEPKEDYDDIIDSIVVRP